jgi:hypothetical protein
VPAADFNDYMYEYLSNQGKPGPWPAPPGQERALADPPAFDRAAIAEVIAITGDTRRLTYIAGCLLGAVLAGAATVGAALLVRGQPLSLGMVGLLIPVIVSWLVTAALVLYSEGPVTSAFAELRRVTGAPVDPSAPWVPLGVQTLADLEVTWDYIVPVIAATRRQHERTRRALSAAVLTTAAFLVWMVLSLTVAALP